MPSEPQSITVREIILIFHPETGAINKILNEQSHITNFEAFFQLAYGFGLDTPLQAAPVNEGQAQE